MGISSRKTQSRPSHRRTGKPVIAADSAILAAAQTIRRCGAPGRGVKFDRHTLRAMRLLWREFALARRVLPRCAGRRSGLIPAFAGGLERHVKEMTDLEPAERTRLMNAVFATEAVLREFLDPDKINLASLGKRHAPPALARDSAPSARFAIFPAQSGPSLRARTSCGARLRTAARLRPH